MDQAFLTKAIEIAIAAGCQSPPNDSFFGADTNFVIRQSNVAGDPEVLTAYLAEIRKDADIARFASLFSAGPCGGVSIGVDQIGKLLLAQSLVTGDIAGTVAKFACHSAKNEARALAVMAVSDVKVSKHVRIGPVMLLPLEDVPPSSQRGIALAQDTVGIGPRYPFPSAFVMEYRHRPAYYQPKTPQPPEETGSQTATNAFFMLDEARTLLSLFGVHPASRMMWSQPLDWIEAGGLGSGWQSSPGSEFSLEKTFDADAAEKTANDYFAIADALRLKVLRVPLDRLNKALSEWEFVDRVIDLGIGLEALLLHNLGKDRVELGYRFSLHGAWLLGKSACERAAIQEALRSMYRLRSQAVHVGCIEYSRDNAATFAHAVELCQKLILEMIARKCSVDWSQLVLGPEPQPSDLHQ